MNVAGEITVPGDKSITHRALFLAGLAPGASRVGGALTSLDARSSARFLRAVGVGVSPLRAGVAVRVDGRARWRSPTEAIHCGNAGTTARLGLGLLAGQPVAATLTGDASLRRRPMARVTEPLARMGARFSPADADRLPIAVRGGRLSSLRWELPVSSAQLKSALLLAGLVSGVDVAVREPAGRSRDHTERMLRGLGIDVREEEGWIRLRPRAGLPPFAFDVPGDLSSAAFPVGAALLAARGELVIRGVGLNPTRTAFLDVVRRMGARLDAAVTAEPCGEPRGDLAVRPSELRATIVAAHEVPGLIDEIPMLAVLAARAWGTTRFEAVGELRVKESDRLGLLAANLTALGYEAWTEGANLSVVGHDRPPRGRVRTAGDHRIAMAFAVLGTVRDARVTLDDRACVAVSYPGFFLDLRRIRG
jgi:3-phosphoshikimate 1-carboxyvinyltransferase